MERVMKNILLFIVAVTAFNLVHSMQKPTPNEVTDYLAKNSIVSSLEKTQTAHDAIKAINELLKSPVLSAQAQEGCFDQLIADAVQHKFPKSPLSFFQLTHGIGERLAQNYFKNIRNYNKDTDHTAVRQLLHDNWLVLVGKGTDNTAENIDEQINQVINKYTTRVICNLNNQIVGFITYACQRIFSECSIKFIAIDSQFKGNGFGKKLIEYAQYDAQNKKLSTMLLRVFQDNTNAINFYRTLGFTAHNHNYSMPAFTMKKNIEERML